MSRYFDLPPDVDNPGPNDGGGSSEGDLTWRFYLYVAGDSPHSRLALSNLHQICEEHLSGRCRVEVIDVLEQPGRALNDGVIVTPTLIKLSPSPVARLMGNLSNRKTVLLVLGLE